MSKISINSITPSDLGTDFEIVIDETTQIPRLICSSGIYRLVIGITKYEAEHPEVNNGITEIDVDLEKTILTKASILSGKNKKRLISDGGILVWQKIENK